jgi:hypothetical protein
MAKKIKEEKESGATGKTAPQVKDYDVRDTLDAKIADQTLFGDFRTFKSGSRGWFLNGKVMVDGVKCQVSCSVTIIGSKPKGEK